MLLSVEDLEVSFKTYLGKVHAVRGISFDVKPGETIAIVGESGCGKSVTAHTIMGLTPTNNIDKGSITFEDNPILGQPRKVMQQIRGKQIAMIFQDPMTSLNPSMRIGKQIMEVLPKNIAEKRALELLNLVEISHPEKRMRQYPHELSGGMRQRVMIAIALAHNPKLLIADEPTTALDVTIQAQILNLMKKVQKQLGMSIILITHDLGIVAGMCDRVLVMYAGKIVEASSVNELYASPAHPYTRGLLNSIPRLDMESHSILEPISGSPPNLLIPPPGCAFSSRCPLATSACQQKMPLLQQINEKQKVACWESPS